jgi:pimeloyl-ACP methyl ester carboxylesterase
MIISHGLGGDENGNAGLAAAMGQAGWRVIVMGHRESGRPALRRAIFSGNATEGLITAASDPASHRARFLDLDAAVADATRACRPSRFVLAGHSMGAMTTMLEAGAVARFAQSGRNRFDAYEALSPQGVGPFFAEGSWREVSRPVLMITGTRDRTADGPPEGRRTAFAGLPAGRKRFAVIPGAGHLALAAGGDDDVSRRIAALTMEFLDGLARGGVLPPSRLGGIDVRDK